MRIASGEREGAVRERAAEQSAAGGLGPGVDRSLVTGHWRRRRWRRLLLIVNARSAIGPIELLDDSEGDDESILVVKMSHWSKWKWN